MRRSAQATGHRVVESVVRDSCKNLAFGQRRCDALPLAVKIFSLPKTATQSPREQLSGGIGESRRGRTHDVRRLR
ncbi:MAG: hypothetical protein ACRECG_05415, partial [Bradyrhizobium sp.]